MSGKLKKNEGFPTTSGSVGCDQPGMQRWLVGGVVFEVCFFALDLEFLSDFGVM